MIPLTPCCRNNVPLSEKLKAVSYEGTCVIAAHQKYLKEGKTGFIDENGNPRSSEIEHFSEFGNSVIENYIKN
jgi:hypothetical protein